MSMEKFISEFVDSLNEYFFNEWPDDTSISIDSDSLLRMIKYDAEATGEDIHIINTDYGDWTIKHPLLERFEGDVFECDMHQKFDDMYHYNIPEDGYYELNEDGSIKELS